MLSPRKHRTFENLIYMEREEEKTDPMTYNKKPKKTITKRQRKRYCCLEGNKRKE